MKHISALLLILFSIFNAFSNDSTVIAGIMKMNGYKKFNYDGISEFMNGRAISFNVDYVDPLRESGGTEIPTYSLDTVPLEFSQLSMLRSLNIRGDVKFSELSRNIKFNELTEVQIFNSGLESLPSIIRNMPNLKTLVIKMTPISEIPKWIGELSQLEYISFEGVPLTSVPKELWNCKKLREVAFKMTSLTSLPDGIDNLQYLETFELTQSGVEKLPSGMFSIPTLFRFNIKSNNIQALPTINIDLNNISTFEISDNQLCNLSSALMEWLDSVKPQWRFFQNCSDEFRQIPDKVIPIEVTDNYNDMGVEPTSPRASGIPKGSFKTFTTIFPYSSSRMAQVIDGKILVIRDLPSLKLLYTYKFGDDITGASPLSLSAIQIAIKGLGLFEFNPEDGSSTPVVSLPSQCNIVTAYNSLGEKWVITNHGVVSTSDMKLYRNDSYQTGVNEVAMFKGMVPSWTYLSGNGIIWTLYRFEKGLGELFAFDTGKKQYLNLKMSDDINVNDIRGATEAQGGRIYFSTALGGTELLGKIIIADESNLSLLPVFTNKVLKSFNDNSMAIDDGVAVAKKGRGTLYNGVISYNPWSNGYEVFCNRGFLKLGIGSKGGVPLSKVAQPVSFAVSPYSVYYYNGGEFLFQNSSNEGFGYFSQWEITVK